MIAAYVVLVVTVTLCACLVFRRYRVNARLRERRRIYAQAEIRPGEDRRMLYIANYYGLTIQQVRERLAEGCTIGRFFDRLILYPPAPPMPRCAEPKR